MKKIIMLLLLLIISQVDMISQSRSSCLPEGILFSRQSQVDSFQIYYQGCTEIGGNVTIKGADITSLAGLSVLTAIGGSLSLSGLPLASLAGLENLTSTGGLYIGDLYLGGLNNLVNLEGLDNLAEIHGDLSIQADSGLVSLAGLENLASVDGDLFILGNPSLTDCSIQGICDFLSDPGGSINIYNNGVGCNSPPEAAAACGTELPCLPYGNYYLMSQSDVDNFAVNYMGCNELQGNLTISGDDISNLDGLSGLISVGGSLFISGDTTLTHLDGLDALTSVGGSLELSGNTHLADLSGLGSLDSIGGNLDIGVHWAGNTSLASLDGIENLVSVGGHLNITKNTVLESLSGLSGLSSLGGSMIITGNTSLGSLAGLDGLVSVGGNLIIGENQSLTGLSGLENITSIAGQVQVFWNASLTGLEGLNNIDAASVTGLSVTDNSSLSTCDVESVCSYLAGSVGQVEIHGNAAGCRNPFQVANACGMVFPCVPGNYYFYSQADIDDFQSYSDCTVLEGNVIIRGNDITNLDGLNEVVQILGGLEVSECLLLESLNGLNNLTSIAGSLSIHYNSALTGLSGLESLSSAGDLSVMGNDALISLDGLEQLATVNGGIRIGSYNNELTSIEGISNIEAGSISYLTIIYNDKLSTCEVESVCEFLASPNGTVTIYENDPGCNSVEEVEVACGVGVESAVGGRRSAVSSYPNPTGGISHFSFHISQCQWVSLKIYNAQGQEVTMVLDEKLPAGEHTVRWDAGELPAGIYYYRLTMIPAFAGTGDRRLTTGTGKIVKY